MAVHLYVWQQRGRGGVIKRGRKRAALLAGLIVPEEKKNTCIWLD